MTLFKWRVKLPIQTEMPRHRTAVAWDIVVTWALVVFMAVAFYAGIFVWLI